MTEAEKQAEIERLEAKLRASQALGGGYAERIKAIEARLVELRNG